MSLVSEAVIAVLLPCAATRETSASYGATKKSNKFEPDPHLHGRHHISPYNNASLSTNSPNAHGPVIALIQITIRRPLFRILSNNRNRLGNRKWETNARRSRARILEQDSRSRGDFFHECGVCICADVDV
jgi:hypothetical protein